MPTTKGATPRGKPFAPGVSGNPGGRPKAVRELLQMARESVPRALERARQILDDDDAEWRAWLEAGKFLAAYGLGAPPKVLPEDSARAADDALNALTVAELRALARQSLADDAAPLDEDDDDEGLPQ